jgi:uncharacterized membrane protein YgcG
VAQIKCDHAAFSCIHYIETLLRTSGRLTLKITLSKKIIIGAVTCAVALVGVGGLQAGPSQDAPPTMQGQQVQPGQLAPQAAHLSASQLQQLVAPIALYPDALVAQILAASAYPTQIVEAQRFMQANPNLKGKELGAQVDQQDWDPSVKALTQFPSVLADMDKNLSWTSTLGDANVNQQGEVMDAVQFMRHKAEQSGNLKSGAQETVQDQGSTVEIAPTDPQIVYVPDYDPNIVYGYPVGYWPGFYPWWGIGGPWSWGVGFGIGPFFGFGWGWGGWGFDWGHRGLLYGGHPYAFRSHAFYDRNAFARGNYRGFARPGERGTPNPRGFSNQENRGRNTTNTRGGFGGVQHGGDVRGQSSRGRASMGGGGARGGGGHAGGGHGRGH